MTDSTEDKIESLVCPAAMDTVVRLFVFAAVLLGFGLYCFHDILSGKYADKPETLYFNWACGLITVPLGAFMLGKGIILARKVLVADQDGIGYRGEMAIAWTNIRKIVVRGKGLMDLHYEVEGESGILKLDSLKLRNFKELTAFIESMVTDVSVENMAK